LSGSRSLYDAPRARQTYHLSLHAALPIYRPPRRHDLAERLTSLPEVVADVEVDDPVFWDPGKDRWRRVAGGEFGVRGRRARGTRSEEHTSELQSRENLVCRLPPAKKKDPW